MSEIAIRIDGIGKQYRLGQEGKGRFGYKSLRDSCVNFCRQPLQAMRSIGALNDENSFWALKDVSFEVKRGDVVGIVGRNGAGKSTLLKILSQITKPTTGRINLYGRVGSLLEVGTGFHPELTGRENIFLNGAILGMTRAEVKQKFDEIVEFSEIKKFLDTPVKQYSSGMYTRLAFAVAAHLEPEILIVDEVLAVGDVAFQKKCLGKMKDVADQGRTVLFVSHNMAAVRSLCNRGVLLQDGKVVSVDSAESIVGSYLTAGARPVEQQRFSGRNGMSLEVVDVEVTLEGDRVDFTLTGIVACPKPPPRMGVGVAVLLNDGTVVSRHMPKQLGTAIDLPADKCCFQLKLNDLQFRLNAGDYRLDIEFTEFGVRQMMQIEQVTTFTVPPLDIYGTGLAPYCGPNGVVPMDVSVSNLTAVKIADEFASVP